VAMLESEANPILGLNVVIDDHRRLGFVSYGHIRASHAASVRFVRRFAEVPVVGPRFGTVVTSSAGYPLDKTYYQTVKGMCLALGVLEEGGDLFIVSECSEGLGSEEFRAAQARLVSEGADAFMAALPAKKHADIDEWQTEMLLRAQRHAKGSIYLCAPRQRRSGGKLLACIVSARARRVNAKCLPVRCTQVRAGAVCVGR
jgi:nickel-dependent lactate racemase